MRTAALVASLRKELDMSIRKAEKAHVPKTLEIRLQDKVQAAI